MAFLCPESHRGLLANYQRFGDSKPTLITLNRVYHRITGDGFFFAFHLPTIRSPENFKEKVFTKVASFYFLVTIV
jgi:hypothetical protein